MLSENLIIQTPFFQFATAFNGLSTSEMIREQYQQIAIPVIENATKEMDRVMDVLPTFTPKEAQKHLNTLNSISAMIRFSREKLVEVEKPEFRGFRSAALSFFQSMDLVVSALEKAASQSDATRAVFQHRTRARKNPAMGKYL